MYLALWEADSLFSMLLSRSWMNVSQMKILAWIILPKEYPKTINREGGNDKCL